jgi:hydrogenase nickel incorporation protein HypA/HybF
MSGNLSIQCATFSILQRFIHVALNLNAMHEVSLVRTIFRTLAEQFPPEELAKLKAVQLKIGPLANVEPILLQNAFSAVLEEEAQGYGQLQLRVNMIPILIQCQSCGQQSEVENYRFVCQQCGQPSGNVVQGNELLIESVEIGE